MFEDLRERAAAEYDEQELEPEPSNTLVELIGALTPQQRFALSLLLLLNVIVLGCMCLVAFNRIQL